MRPSNAVLEFAAEYAAGRNFDLQLVSVIDSWGELTGYRLATQDGLCTSRLYLSREDALDAWTDRAIEWEDIA